MAAVSSSSSSTSPRPDATAEQSLGCKAEDHLGGCTLHAVTGHLVVRLSGCGLKDAAVRVWAMSRLLPQVETFRDAGNVIRQADFDLSHNELTDAGLASFLRAWGKTGAACPLLLKLHFNRLADPALAVLAAFIRTYRGQVRELHLTNNLFSDQNSVYGLLESFAGLPQYPMWIRRQRRFAPVYVRLGQCNIEEPCALMDRAAASSGLRLCLMEEGRCSKTLCCQAERGNTESCPVAHLYDFLKQGGGSEAAAAAESAQETCLSGDPEEGPGSTTAAPAASAEFIDAPAAPAAAPSAAPSPGKGTREGRPTYDCGTCGRWLPLDMFGRHQFRKAAAVDALPGGTVEEEGHSAEAPAHIVRRCNDCVRQPCSACGEELPLTSFGKSQMMRPRGQRRCRICTAETMLCIRCGLPKPRSAFSPVEVLKRKLLPRVCGECEQTNPYFERRYGLVLIFSPKRSSLGAGKATLPRLPLDILRRIVAFSEPGDEFTRVQRREFECGLCGRSWSFATNDVERHVRHSQVHKQRLEKLLSGHLVRIGSLDLETSRFRTGLGIKGAVCSRERVEEARALVRVKDATDQGLGMEALRVAGLEPENEWVAPRVVEAAMQLQLGTASASVPQASSAEVKSAQRRWKLFGHMGAEDPEGYADAAEELSAVSALLSFEGGDL